MKSKRKTVLYGLAVWVIPFVAADLAMLIGGPIEATFAEYVKSTGLRYLLIPVVTAGFGCLPEKRQYAAEEIQNGQGRGAVPKMLFDMSSRAISGD